MLNLAGSGYTLSASSGNLAPGTSTAIAVSAAAASQLVVTTAPPASVTAGTGFGMVVAAEDSFGNVATTSTTPITLSAGGLALGGTTTVTPIAGVAAFSGLSLTQTGSESLRVSRAAFPSPPPPSTSWQRRPRNWCSPSSPDSGRQRPATS